MDHVIYSQADSYLRFVTFNFQEFLLTLSGAVRRLVLREEEVTNSILVEVADAFYDFCKNFPDGQHVAEDHLKCAFVLQTQLSSLVGKCQFVDTPPEWMGRFKDAADRFASKLSVVTTEWVKSLLRSGKLSTVKEFFNSCDLPGSPGTLTKLAAIIEHYEFLLSLEPPEPTDLFSELGTRMKSFITISSLDEAILSDLVPDIHQKANNYKESVQTNVMQEVEKMRGQLTKSITRMETYRLGCFCPFYLQHHATPATCQESRIC